MGGQINFWSHTACTSRAGPARETHGYSYKGVIIISSTSVPQKKGLISLSPAQLKAMNKFLLICLAGAALVALSGAEVSSEEQSVAELAQLREVRAADSGKGKGLKKKGKKNKKGRNLNKSEKKGDRKKKGDHKKKGRENGAKKKKSRKNKANGADKNKNKKKARKAAKKADKKEKKKARKEKKKEQKKAKKDRKNNNNKKVNIERQSSCANETCIDNAVTYMKQLKLAVKNFGKQYNRILTNAKQSSGKSSKNNVFAPYLTKLRETGGGNASNLTCNGQKNQGAVNLETLYNNLATCETIINATCHEDNMPDVNMTFLDACKATMDNFTAKANEAIKAKGSAACVIWESAEMAEMSGMLKGCSVKSLESTHTAAKKACTGNFSYCRQEEDKVSKIVSACSASNSADKVAAAAAQGVKNQAAATAVSQKINDTLAARRSASPRTSTNITCADFAVEVTTVSAQVSSAPLLASLATMLTTIVAYTVGECSTDDVTSLGTAITTFLKSTEDITIAIAEKQAALTISTGTTLSLAGLSAITVTTTSGTTGTTGTTTTGTTGTTTTGTTTTGTTGTTTTGTTTTTTTGTTTTGATTTAGTTTTGTTATTTTGTTT